MHFFCSEKFSDPELSSKEILIEFMKQYADCFQHLGTDYWGRTIKPNLQLLQMVVEEWKDDQQLELHNLIEGKNED